MSSELKEAIELIEKEKGISKASLLDSIEQSLMTACKSHFGKNDNIIVSIDPDTCEFSVTAEKEVVEDEDHIVDSTLQVTLEEARQTDPHVMAGDIITVDINSKQFGRIATMNAKNIILQRIREEERNAVYNQYNSKIREMVSGVVSRMQGKSYYINLGKADALLNENEQVKTEHFQPTERVKVFVVDVKNSTKGPKILVSRTHPDLVRKLFEEEVAEVRDGTVEIKAISREPGSRTKMSVWSNDPDVDPVGACVGMNGARVGAVVNELRGEKIDIVAWDENPAVLIENALSPAKVITVGADPDERSAKVIVPDYQLSLAIGKEGQNARLAARLTGYKIDIKSETQARESGDFDELYLDDFDENGEYYEEDEYYDDSLVPEDAGEDVPRLSEDGE
ncbi:MAG: transcription termination/antitermination protein NusA [Lachnospiraceae bacterium]|nr:transcription termination/antitermination protein NusA [Lachnospiraceae bacterium]